MPDSDWFVSWFNSPYYHLLYNYRNEREAEVFIANLTTKLELPLHSSILDFACGKGRHCGAFDELGYKSIGYDLSPESINSAKKNYPNCNFVVHDMRESFPQKDFNAAFNLFTSFGYFEDDQTDLSVLKNVYDCLIIGGYFVQDFLNGAHAMQYFPSEQVINRDGIIFNINKEYHAPYFVKSIEVNDQGKLCRFKEKVKNYTMDKLKQMHTLCGFDVIETFGDYELNPFDEAHSNRLIIISKKA